MLSCKAISCVHEDVNTKAVRRHVEVRGMSEKIVKMVPYLRSVYDVNVTGPINITRKYYRGISTTEGTSTSKTETKSMVAEVNMGFQTQGFSIGASASYGSETSFHREKFESTTLETSEEVAISQTFDSEDESLVIKSFCRWFVDTPILPCRTGEIYVGNSDTNSRTITLPEKGLFVSPTPRNPQDPNWNNRFSVSVVNDQLTVKRLDNPNWGWGQNLVLGYSTQEEILIGPSDHNTKEVPLPETMEGITYVSQTPCNLQDPNWNNTFDVELVNNKVIVKRTDNPNWGWGQNLRLKVAKVPQQYSVDVHSKKMTSFIFSNGKIKAPVNGENVEMTLAQASKQWAGGETFDFKYTKGANDDLTGFQLDAGDIPFKEPFTGHSSKGIEVLGWETRKVGSTTASWIPVPYGRETLLRVQVTNDNYFHVRHKGTGDQWRENPDYRSNDRYDGVMFFHHSSGSLDMSCYKLSGIWTVKLRWDDWTERSSKSIKVYAYNRGIEQVNTTMSWQNVPRDGKNYYFRLKPDNNGFFELKNGWGEKWTARGNPWYVSPTGVNCVMIKHHKSPDNRIWLHVAEVSKA